MIDLKAIFGDVQYKLTSPFGYRSVLGLPAGASAFHQGVDWAVPSGAKIGAFESGKVDFVGFDNSRGNYVRVAHSGGIFSEYSHLESVLVSKGQTLPKGGVLGIAGDTGIASGVHLDFKIKKDGKYIDPLKLDTATLGGVSGLNIEVDALMDMIKNYWYYIAGGLLLFAVFTKK